MGGLGLLSRAALLPYETKPLFGVVPFDRTDAFLGRPDARLSLRGRAWVPLRRARRWGCTRVHFDQCADLWTLQPLADLYLDASALRQAGMSCCLQKTDVNESILSTGHSHKTEALFGIEPFDNCIDRFRSWQFRSASDCSAVFWRLDPGGCNRRSRGALAHGNLCSGPFDCPREIAAIKSLVRSAD